MSTLLVAFIVYVITIISSVDGFLTFLAVAGGVTLVVNIILTLAMYADDDLGFPDEVERFNKEMAPVRAWRKWSIAVFILGAMNIFVPNEEQAMTIAAVAIGYEGVTTIVENERVQDIGGKTVDYLEEWLDSKIEELDNEDTQTEGESNGNS